MSEVSTKPCNKCKRELPATSEVFITSAYTKSGIGASCRDCERERKQAYKRSPAGKAANRAYLKRRRERRKSMTIEVAAEKRCPHCGITRPATDWTKNIGNADGLDSRCNPCNIHRSEAWRLRDPAYRQRRADRERRERLGLAICYVCEQEYPRTLEFFLSRNGGDGIRTKCKGCNNAGRAQYRARQYAAQGYFTAADVSQLLAGQKGRCWWCTKKLPGGRYHVDHRIPLRRGGTNEASNLVIACPTCNLRKHAKLPHEWIGRLL